jgi:plasmid stability protein
MATLHVRNVPDELYERLRLTAERNGRSIGAETIVILQTMLAGEASPPPLPPARRRGKPKSPFEHFSPRSRELIVEAQAEAAGLGHESIGTEHLLLGLLHETKIAIALEPIGLTLEGAREEVVQAVGEGKWVGAEQVPFSALAKKALELALRESLRLGRSVLAPEHLLLGVLGVEEGVGARIVLEHERSLERVRMNVLQVAANPAASLRYGVDEFRVVELEGDPSAWQSQLNETGQRGYKLVQIVDRRAIFRRSW